MRNVLERLKKKKGKSGYTTNLRILDPEAAKIDLAQCIAARSAHWK
jgi:hypothetical protein